MGVSEIDRDDDGKAMEGKVNNTSLTRAGARPASWAGLAATNRKPGIASSSEAAERELEKYWVYCVPRSLAWGVVLVLPFRGQNRVRRGKS